MNSYKRNKTAAPDSLWKGLVLLLLLFVLVGVLAARWIRTPVTNNHQDREPAENSTWIPEETRETGSPAVSAAGDVSDDMLPDEESPVMVDAPAASDDRSEPELQYTEATYRIVTDLVHECRQGGLTDQPEMVSAKLEELKAVNPELGLFWQRTIDYLAYTQSELVINRSFVPEGLPEDDSLCIAVLGFQLLYDGEMAPELLGRCELALAAVQRYPNAFLAVTGGGTAMGNPAATEADVMADWFVSHGVAADRIIIENQSLTTDQNAVNTGAILVKDFPQVKEIMIVTSDYHVSLGCMMFSEAAYLYSMETGNPVPFSVIANMAYATSGNPEYSGVKNLLSYIWVMANPTY